MFAWQESQAQYFKVFVDDEDFASYIARMKYEGCEEKKRTVPFWFSWLTNSPHNCSQWGGEPEIRAMGEIYQRPVEIYVYSLGTNVGFESAH